MPIPGLIGGGLAIGALYATRNKKVTGKVPMPESKKAREYRLKFEKAQKTKKKIGKK